jgi:thiamine biosynthesis lipoprotein
MKKTKLISMLVVTVLLGFLLTACGNRASSERKVILSPVKKTEFLLGTVISLQVYHEDTEEIIDQAFQMVKDLEARITVNQAGSEVDQVNDSSGIAPVKVSPEIFQLIQDGLLYSKESQGSFDITVGPLVNLWRIGFDDARKPSQEEIDQTLPLVDYSKVEVNEVDSTVYLPVKGMKLDLGGIAKGYIADKIWALFKENNISTAVIDLGGNIVVIGGSPARDGVAWNVGIQDPFQVRGTTIGAILEKDMSLVTSGIYERYLEVDGKTYHHILNPKTGYPYDNDIAGVSIIVNNSTRGDALSTTVFSLGLEAGLAYLNKESNVSGIIVTKENGVYLTDDIKDTFTLTNDAFTLKN